MADASYLTPEEQARYARQMRLPEIGDAGQKKLKAARVLIIGVGGLGCPASLYLAAAGIGTLGLVDADNVDASNLHRQILYGTGDIGRSKARVAAEKLAAINPQLILHPYEKSFTAANAARLLADYDLVIDGTDTFAAHYLINDACVLHNKPLIYASVSLFAGQVGAIIPHQTACYRCLYPAPPPAHFVPSCAAAGTIGTVPGMVGMLQAHEAIKIILGLDTTLAGHLLSIDTIVMRFQNMQVSRDAGCAVCGDKPSIAELKEPQPATCLTIDDITAAELCQLIASGTPPFILDVRNEDEFADRRIAGSVLIPLPELPQRWQELDPAKPMIVHCKSGRRSASAIGFLQTQGFTHMRNLKGGIDAFNAL